METKECSLKNNTDDRNNIEPAEGNIVENIELSPFLGEVEHNSIAIRRETATEHSSRKYDRKDTKYLSIHLFKNCKMSFNKALIPLRIALIFWYGAARIAIVYLSVFMKQRGLSLVEFSSVFSITFLLEFLTSTISGIVADRIGNAKPVLMFHLICTMSLIVGMIVSPRLDSEMCVQSRKNFACSDYFKNEDQEMLTNLTFCNWTCSGSDPILYKQTDTRNKSYEEEMASKFFDLLVHNSGFEKDINYSSFKDSNDSYLNSNNTVIHSLCGEINNDCLISCTEDFKTYCTPASKIYLAIYVSLILCFIASFASVYRFMDITVMSLIHKHDSSFGHERFFCAVGEFVIMFSAGMILKSHTLEGAKNNYESIYWFSVSMIFIVIAAVYNIKAQIKLPARNMRKEASKLIRNPDIVVFILVVFILGSSFSHVQKYTLWFMEYLDAPKILFAILPASLCLYGLPFLATSKWWLKKIGTSQLLILGLLGYAIFGIGYSLMSNPWWSLILSATHIFTYHLLWVTVMVYSHEIAPEELVSTVLATVGAIHFSLGRSSGTLTGGLLTNAYGPRIAFRILAATNFATAILFVTYLYVRRMSTKKSVTVAVPMQSERNVHLENNSLSAVC